MGNQAEQMRSGMKKAPDGTAKLRAGDAASSPCDVELLARSCERWLLGEWSALSALTPESVAGHADRIALMMLAAGAALRLGEREVAQRCSDSAREWGAAKKRIATVLMAATRHSLGSAVAPEDVRAEEHFADALRLIGVEAALATELAHALRAEAPDHAHPEAVGQMLEWLRSQEEPLRSAPVTPVAGQPRIGVLSGYYPGQRFNSPVNHRLYCAQHGYPYIFDATPRFDKRTYMRKLEAVREYLGLFDWLFWIDDDAYFTDFSVPLERFIDQAPDADFIVCKSPSTKEVFTRISSGQFLLRNTERARQFIEDALVVDLHDVQKWWKSHLGLFTKGDQDALVYLLEARAEYEQPFFRILDHQCFNNRDFEYERQLDEHFLVHFTGKQKQSDKARLCQRLQCNEYLSPPELVDELALR